MRIFLGPVTFTLQGSRDNVEEAFNHVKLHKRRASFIDLQRSSTPWFFAPGGSLNIREVADRIPAKHGSRTVQPQFYDGTQPLAVPLPQGRPLKALNSRKEILLI